MIFLQIKEDKFGKEILKKIGQRGILIKNKTNLLNGKD